MSATSWLQGVSMACPSGWSDRTIMAFSAPRIPGETLPPNVTLARDLRDAPGDDPAEALEDYTQRQLRALETALPGFRLERRGAAALGGAPGTELLFSWDSGQGRLRQWLTYLPLSDASILSFTGTALAGRFAECEPLFARTLASLRVDLGRGTPVRGRG